ncbi:MAG TPA: hypothetical protein VKU39_17795 [Streptosporangiaceae bacterium]|nr:hypothetical protein [Streptosporangiaceae bacterium]
MSERYWRARAAAVLLAGATGAVVAGCGANGGNSAAGGSANGGTTASGLAGAPGTGQADGTGQGGTGQGAQGPDGTQGKNSAGLTALAGGSGISAAGLRDALLTRIGGESPVGPVQFGAYGSLADVRASKQSLNAVTVTPATCAQATQTGLDSGLFAQAPASVVTFRVGRDGVSEVLVAASARTAAKALQNHLPAGCEHYQATVAGKTFSYAVHESAVPGVAEQARALNVKATGYADVDVWSVVFRGNGFLGAVTIVGPDATERTATVLARAAYTKAAETLRAKVR